MPITPGEIKLLIFAGVAVFIMGLLLTISGLSSAYNTQKDKTKTAEVATKVEHAGADAAAGAGQAASVTSEKIVHTYEQTDHYIRSVESAPDLDGVVASWAAGVDGLRAQAANARLAAAGDGVPAGANSVRPPAAP